jgi:hypothetical protein
MVTVGRMMMKPALVTGGCHARTRHSTRPSKCDCSTASEAFWTSMGCTLQRTGAGIT